MRQPLKDLAAICAGQGAPHGDHNYCENGTPFVKAGNLQELLEGKAITSIQKVSDEVAKKHKLRLYPKGTILFAKSGMSCMKGYIYVLPQSAYVVSHLACITPNEDISEYLRYYFNYHKPNQLVKDAAYPSISLSDVGNLVVDMKPESERNEIVSVLQHTESIITLRQQQLQKLNELVKARFVEMFGDSEFNMMQWPTKKLSVLCAASSSKRIYQNEQSTEGVPFLRISDLNERIDNVKNAPELFIPINKYNELKENGLVPTEGDILVTSRGTLGRCYIVRPEDEFYFQDGMISWLSDLNSQITSVYLSQLFAMSGIQKQIASLQAGSTVAYLSIAMLKKLNIMLPPLDLQEQFAAFVEQTDKSKVVVQKALDEAQTLFDSLMQGYFG